MKNPNKKPADAREVIRRLDRAFPGVHTALQYSNPLELLVATILSAQCTDERVNQVTKDLFKKYRSAKDYAEADPVVFQEEIKPTGFFRQKTKSILGLAQRLVDDYGGTVPDRMDDLVKLPGVGRKTANIVLGEAFGKNEGIAVDTHVKRVAFRLGLTGNKEPEKIEEDLMLQVPRDDWTRFSHLLIFHGRRTCVARNPKCAECVLNDICPSAFSF